MLEFSEQCQTLGNDGPEHFTKEYAVMGATKLVWFAGKVLLCFGIATWLVALRLGLGSGG